DLWTSPPPERDVSPAGQGSPQQDTRPRPRPVGRPVAGDVDPVSPASPDAAVPQASTNSARLLHTKGLGPLRARADRRPLWASLRAVVPAVGGPGLAEQATDGDDRVCEVEEGVDDGRAALVAAGEPV